MSVWQMSLWASIIILSTVAIRCAALHRIPKVTFYIMWGLALIRLLVPFRIDISRNVFNLDGFVTGTLASVIETLAPAKHEAPTDSVSLTHALQRLTPIWAIVAAGLVIYFISVHLRCRKAYRLAVPLENTFVDEWLRANRLKWRKVAVKVSSDVPAPLAYGVFRPVIILPKSADWENRVQLEYILTHEMIHVKRLDPVWKLLLLIVSCTHWFNPLVWVMGVLANRDMEITCDEKVIRTLGSNNKAAYALTLIELSKKRNKLVPLGSAFSRNSIEERTRSIMKTKKTSLSGIAVALLLVIGIATVFTVSAFSAQEELPVDISGLLDDTSLADIPAEYGDSDKLVYYYDSPSGDVKRIVFSVGSNIELTSEEQQALWSAFEEVIDRQQVGYARGIRIADKLVLVGFTSGE